MPMYIKYINLLALCKTYTVVTGTHCHQCTNNSQPPPPTTSAHCPPISTIAFARLAPQKFTTNSVQVHLYADLQLFKVYLRKLSIDPVSECPLLNLLLFHCRRKDKWCKHSENKTIMLPLNQQSKMTKCKMTVNAECTKQFLYGFPTTTSSCYKNGMHLCRNM